MSTLTIFTLASMASTRQQLGRESDRYCCCLDTMAARIEAKRRNLKARPFYCWLCCKAEENITIERTASVCLKLKTVEAKL